MRYAGRMFLIFVRHRHADPDDLLFPFEGTDFIDQPLFIRVSRNGEVAVPDKGEQFAVERLCIGKSALPAYGQISSCRHAAVGPGAAAGMTDDAAGHGSFSRGQLALFHCFVCLRIPGDDSEFSQTGH